MAYDGGGLQALKSKPSGGRKRENMTLAEAMLDNAMLRDIAAKNVWSARPCKALGRDTMTVA
jgi:hypothetical protein